MSLRFRLIIAFAFSSIITIIILATVLGLSLHKDATISFRANAEENLIAKREQKISQIQGLIQRVKNQLVLQSQSQWTKKAVTELSEGFEEAKLEVDNYIIKNEKLKRYYQDDFGKEYTRQNGAPANTEIIHSSLSPIAKLMQQAYIAENPMPIGEKQKFQLGDTQSRYDSAHNKYHAEFTRLLENWSYYDIFLVEPDSGHIIYSVFKELDFGTSLISGPYSDTAIADAFNEGKKLNNGDVFLTDFSRYGPSYNNPASFVSTPVFVNGTIEAVLIYQIPIGRINEIMINNNEWVSRGYGESGESYLVGSDLTLLSESRFFIEDQSSYLKLLNSIGENALAQVITAKNTSIGVQPVKTEAVKQALLGNKGFLEVIDYRGVNVFSAYSSIDLGNGVNWAILSEIDVSEALKWVGIMEEHQIVSTLQVAFVTIILSLVLAYYYSNQLSSPMNQLAQNFSDISHGEGDLTQRIAKQDIGELNQVGEGFNDFLEQVEAIVEQVKLSSSNLTALSDTLEQSARASSGNTNNQKDSTLMVTAAMEEYNASFNEVARNTKAASEDAQRAAGESTASADESRKASGKINQLVEKLSDSSESVKQLESEVENIKGVLTTITSIADQTNLLALNAAIEAARAGEQGRGFAVVADEVRTLAGRTQKTTVEIQSKMDELQKAAQFTAKNITESSKQANDGSQIVENVAIKLDNLAIAVKEVENKNMEIASATTQQLATAQEINQQLENITSFSSDLSSTAKEVADAVDQINAISLGISVLMDRFKVKQT